MQSLCIVFTLCHGGSFLYKCVCVCLMKYFKSISGGGEFRDRFHVLSTKLLSRYEND